jgi:hypothetical protein
VPQIMATALVTAATLYLGVGVIVAPFIAWFGVKRLDPGAAQGTTGFRVLILPGLVILWPLLLTRWLRGAGPPEERNAHRLAARRTTGP